MKTWCVAGLAVICMVASGPSLAAQRPSEPTVQRYAGLGVDRVVLQSLHSEVDVRAATDDSIRVQFTGDGTVRLDPERSGTLLELHERRPVREAALKTHYLIVAPPGVQLEIIVRSGDVRVDGMHGGLRVNVAEGAITARELAGTVELSAVTGGVTVRGASGPLSARSVAGDVLLDEIGGPVRARSTSGMVRISTSAAVHVDAESYSGRVELRGSIAAGEPSILATNSGAIMISVPAGAGLTIEPRSIHAAVTGRCREARRQGTAVVLGNGSARLEAISFSGDISIACPDSRSAGGAGGRQVGPL